MPPVAGGNPPPLFAPPPIEALAPCCAACPAWRICWVPACLTFRAPRLALLIALLAIPPSWLLPLNVPLFSEFFGVCQALAEGF